MTAYFWNFPTNSKANYDRHEYNRNQHIKLDLVRRYHQRIFMGTLMHIRLAEQFKGQQEKKNKSDNQTQSKIDKKY